ncbi:MAG: hypothetical protein AAFX08_10720 [Pseudomonadota bacterium]
MRKVLVASVAGLLAFYSSAAMASTVVVDGAGQAIGVDGVDVAGVSFDFRFATGSFQDNFSGGLDPVLAGSQANATAIAQSITAAFDGTVYGADTDRIFGCENASQLNTSCQITIPFLDEATRALAVNLVEFSTPFNDFVQGVVSLGLGGEINTNGNAVWAVASRASDSSVIPLPAALPLFLVGLGGVVGVSRRRRG